MTVAYRQAFRRFAYGQLTIQSLLQGVNELPDSRRRGSRFC